MAYLDLILRSVTEPCLMKMFIKFLLDETKFDGDRILDVLVERLMSPNNRVSASAAAITNRKWAAHSRIAIFIRILY